MSDIDAVAKDTGELIPVKATLGLPGEVRRVGLLLPDGLAFEEWQSIGQTLNSVEGSIQWWVGDWLNYGERKYGEMYSQAMDATERAYQSLANAKYVASRFEFSRRRENLSWGHHSEVAGQTPSDADDILRAADECGWSVKETRAEVNRRKNAKALNLPANDTCTVADLGALIAAGKKFGCIYADPPWLYDNQGTRAATGNHYSGMTVDDLCKLPVRELAADDAHLHLWTTNGFLFDCAKIFDAWGFEFRSSFVWVKPQMGIGNYWRNSHEFLLTAIRGEAKRFNDKGLMSWLSCDRAQHSAKPEQVRSYIERASSGPYLELFGRRSAPNWAVWGNQIERTMFDAAVKEVA